MKRRKHKLSNGIAGDIWIALAFCAAAIVVPLAGTSNYILSQATLFFIWASVVTQWNLVFGFAGVITLGHMAVFAVGAYTTGMLGVYFQWTPWASLPVAALTGVIASLLMGAATLRLRGPYIAVMTLAIAQAVYSLILTDVECFTTTATGGCQNLTGGARGLFNYGDFGFAKLLGFQYRVIGDYYLTLALLILSTLFAFFIIYSAFGATFRALRDNQICAEARGVDRVKFQYLAFGASGVFTGLSGAVFAGVQRTAGPDLLSIPLLLFILSMMVVGGRGTKWGPILGAGALMLADTVLRDVPQFRIAILSLLILLFMIFLPRGIAGLVSDIFRWKPERNDGRSNVGGDTVPRIAGIARNRGSAALAGRRAV